MAGLRGTGLESPKRQDAQEPVRGTGPKKLASVKFVWPPFVWSQMGPLRFVRSQFVWPGLVGPLLLAAALPVLADPATGVSQNTNPNSGPNSGPNMGQSSGQNPAPYTLADGAAPDGYGLDGTGQNKPKPGTAKPAAVAAPPLLVFNLSSGLTFDTNPNLTSPASGGGGQFDIGLGLVLNKSTKISTLTLEANGLVKVGNQGSGTNTANTGGLPEPSVKLTYGVNTGNTKANVILGVDVSPVDVFAPTTLPDGTLISTDLAAATGTVTHQDVAFTFNTGIERPLGFDLAGNYDGRLYSDTTSTSVYDSNVRSGSAGLHWRIDGLNTVRLTANASGSNYANATATTQQEQDLSLGYTRLLRPDLRLEASLGHSNASATENGVTTNSSSGFVGSLGLIQKQAVGTASATLDTSRDALGPRTELSFGRSLVLRGGSFNATAGVSARPGEPGQIVGSLDYTHLVLPGDTIDLNVSRQIGLNSDNLDQASNVLGLNWNHKINEASSVSLAVSLAGTTGVDGNGVTSDSRQTLSATWSHDLTKDWKMSAGYQFRTFDSSTADKVVSNSVFLTVNRKLVLLP
jgi:hypothetical protein